MTASEHVDKDTDEVDTTTGTDGRDDVSSRSAGRIFFASRESQDSYMWSAFKTSIGGEAVLAIRNTSGINLYIDSVMVGAEKKTQFIIFQSDGAYSGADSVEMNMHGGGGEAACIHKVGAADLGTEIEGPCVETQIYGYVTLELGGAFIIPPGLGMFVRVVSGSAATCVVVKGYFE